LTKLVVNGSGPYIPDDSDEDESILSDDDLCPVSLPNLRDITIGYRSVYEGQTILECISAPNAHVLTMEDSTHPGDPEDIDAGKLLAYVGTGRFHDANEHIFVSYINGRCFEVDLNDGTKNPFGYSKKLTEKEPNSQSPFPLLEQVTLNGVKACPGALHNFYSGLQNVRKLELSGMSTHAIQALRPFGLPHSQPCPVSTSPCPRLQSLCIRRPEFTQLQEFVILASGLALERLRKGACGLREVDIHVDGTGECVEEDVVRVSPGTTVTVFREVPRDDDDMEFEEDGPVDPFLVGGPFDDSPLDMFYAHRVAHTS